jgi:UDP-GlcNAc:undecaprenyl-phosphate/decaprenyl-phosphate GlcNAc-1-phosphate transferase
MSLVAETVASAVLAAEEPSRLAIVQGYAGVFVVAFIVALVATPIMRRVAVANDIIDRPSEARKVHRIPIAYLGGVAVYLGILAAIFYSYLALRVPSFVEFHPTKHLTDNGVPAPVPLSVLLGITVILLVGVVDDVVKISPRVKVGGQLFAAAALAIDNVGVRLAGGVLLPIFRTLGVPTQTAYLNGSQATGVMHETVLFTIPIHIPGVIDGIPIDMIYWIGTAIIAIAVLGLCNASNLIDGLDGLLSGTTAIANAGLLVIALTLAMVDDGPRDSQRITLCLAVLGACLGFLPHNFNPATIFLGDAGSLLLGFCTCVVILTLGDTGRTELVIAGLIVYAIPIVDTGLAIVRRKMEGKSISSADDQHLHHMLKRALGVKGAVLTLYSIGIAFATLGVLASFSRARVVYVIALVMVSYIGVTAIKIARRRHIESEAAARSAGIAPLTVNQPASEVPATTNSQASTPAA